MILVSYKHKFTLVTIAKNASSTLRTWFYCLEKGNLNEFVNFKSNNKTYRNIHKIVGTKYSNRQINNLYPTFCTIRNPWIRLASCYFDKIEGKHLLPKFNIQNISQFITYLQLIKVDSKNCNGHWRSQHTFVGDVNIDSFIKVENLQQDFDKMLKSIGMQSIKLPNLKKDNSRTIKYNNLYSKREVRIIGKLYSKDVEMGNYFCPDYMIDYNKKSSYISEFVMYIKIQGIFNRKKLKKYIKNFRTSLA